jgi:hypothetical protein
MIYYGESLFAPDKMGGAAQVLQIELILRPAAFVVKMKDFSYRSRTIFRAPVSKLKLPDARRSISEFVDCVREQQ